MNVCVVAEYYPRRRAPALGVWAHRQARAVRDLGADVRVLALERPIPPVAALRDPGRLRREIEAIARQPRHELRDGLEVHLVPFAAPPRASAYATWDRWAEGPLERALGRLTAEWRPDVVHAHYALPAGGAVRGFCRREGMPLVVSVHGGDVYGPQLGPPSARARVASVLRSAAVVLCNSRETRRRAAALAGESERMRVVHLGAEPVQANAKHGEPTVATLGHVVERKRHRDVLEAIRLLEKRLPRLRWVVIGDGEELPRLREEVRAAELGERVDFTSALRHDDAMRELARCHVMALPSLHEAFGVAYIEALACELPAIGCRGEGGPEEIAVLSEAMLLVPPRHPPALADAIEAALEPERLEQLALVAGRSAAEHFSWGRCGRETLAAYESALGAGT